MTGTLWRKHCRRVAGDEGFSMIEVVFSLLIIAIVTTGSLAFFINNLRSVNGQGQRQQAVNLANQQLESIQSLPIAKLVTGRGSAAVSSLNSSATAVKLKLNTQDDIANASNYDPTAPSAGVGNVPTSFVKSVSGINYTIYSFINTCWYAVGTGLCGPASGSGRTQEFRVSVDVAWESQGQCTNTCDYSTSTLIDPTSNPQFNSNISAPTGSYTSVNGNTSPGVNPNVFANSPLTDSCTINGTTVAGTKVVVNGTGFKSSIRVWISSGGGTISNIYQPVAGEVDFCYLASDVPGPYTISIINTDGGHFQLPVTVIPNILTAAGWNPTTKKLSLTGTGFEAGAVFSVSGAGATMGGQTNLVVAHPSSPGDSVDLTNFVGPKDGGTTTLTVTNPDASTDTFTITAPAVSSYTPSAIAAGVTKTVNVVGTGFKSGMTAVAVSGGTAGAVTVSSATAASFAAKPTTAGTNEVVYLYNTNGGFTSTGNIVADALPTVTTFSPTEVTKSVTSNTITVNGTNFMTGMTATPSTGTITSYSIVSSTQIQFKLNASANSTITLLNTDGGSTTFTIVVPTITSFTPNPPAHSTATSWVVNGTGFEPGASVTISEQGSGLSTSNVVVVSSTKITFTATTTNSTASRSFIVTVNNPSPDSTVATLTQTMTPS